MAPDVIRRADTVSTERLAALFDAHQPRLYRLARRLSGDADEARDLVQQAFLQAARHVHRLPAGEPGGEAWLVRTLVNLCRDRRRRLRVREKTVGQLSATPATSNPESQAVARTTVQAALRHLSPRRRTVIVLHELEGRPAAEIARLLGIAIVTVRWHRSAGRKSLRQLLAGEMVARPADAAGKDDRDRGTDG